MRVYIFVYVINNFDKKSLTFNYVVQNEYIISHVYLCIYTHTYM